MNNLFGLSAMGGFDRITKRMSDIVNDIDKGFTIEYGGFAPRIDFLEDESKFYISAEMPGVKKEDVKVSIKEDNILVIKGEKRKVIDADENAETDSKVIIKQERTFGAFTRSFSLPDNIISDSINAKFENGVLNIEITKKEPEKPKEVEIAIL